MTAHINDLMDKIRLLEAELDAEVAQRRIELHVGMEKGQIFFEQEILRRHRELRTRLSTYILNARPLVVLTAPVIYALIVPFVLLDIFVTIYQAIWGCGGRCLMYVRRNQAEGREGGSRCPTAGAYRGHRATFVDYGDADAFGNFPIRFPNKSAEKPPNGYGASVGAASIPSACSSPRDPLIASASV